MKNLMQALAKFQQECPTIQKTTDGYGYKYADLPTIIETINPFLKKYGLAISQPLVSECERTFVRTILWHLESGENLQSEIEVPHIVLGKMNEYQSLGSGITYMRRYALSSVLGIVTDEDTDAAGEQTKQTMKELPWLSQKAFDTAVRRIQEAKPNVIITVDDNQIELTPKEFVDKLVSEYRMKKDYKEALNHEVDFQNTLSNAPDKPQEIPY